MRHRRGTLSLVLAVAAVATLGVGTAAASLWLVLDPAVGPPGTQVRGATLGTGSVSLASGERLPLFLVAHSDAGNVSTPDDDRLLPVGDLVVDRAGDGSTSFVIPAVAPGRYTVMVHCEACAPSSAGAIMLGVGEFRVSTSPPSTDTEEGPRVVGTVPYVVLALTLAAAVGLPSLRARRGRHSN